MANSETPEQRAPLFRSPGFKLLLIVVLTVAMAVPLLFIQLALSEREGRAAEAAQDVASGWGGAQIVAGPLLFVPYEVERRELVDGRSVTYTDRHVAVLLPDELDLKASADTQERMRGIFAVPVYRAGISLRAKYVQAALAGITPADAHVLWDQAFVSVQISDVRGLAGNIMLRVNGIARAFEPGIGIEGSNAPGIHAPLGFSSARSALELQTDIPLRGSRELSFAPLGKQTVATIHSEWKDPSFFGNFLPTERHIGSVGFDASWNVPYLARGMAQNFSSPENAMQVLLASTFGVRFYQPVDFYQLVQRSLKYAVLFVGLAFLIFFVAELIAGRKLHAVQYTLIGAAQVLFYLLLLSLAEHIGFVSAYLLATGATVTLTGLYAASAFASRLRAALLTIVLSGLYGLLYVILNQEDYALLIGAGVSFLALAATMYATRRVDWARVAGSPAG